MARKPAPPLKNPPSASSSEEEETSSGEEEASDDERSQPSPPQHHRTRNSTPKKPEPTTPQSESELESESGSDSESEPEPGQSVKPITSKPMEEIPPKEAAAAVVKKSRSKPAVAATPEKSTAVKRGNGADRDAKDLKRAKNKQSDPEKSEDSKKQLFQRLWTEDDEISLLQDLAKKKFKNQVKGKKAKTRKASVGTMEDYVGRCGLDFMHGVKKEEMEEKWRKLHIAELELFLKRNELLGEQGKIMLSALKADKD
uniref:Uncharacterized protein n=1 Tax=Salix viminalis TaxID=40686 RepID=A0A6N2MZW5_SALVM